jgi:polyferredoxin
LEIREFSCIAPKNLASLFAVNRIFCCYSVNFNFVSGVTVQGAPTQLPVCDISGSSKRRKKKKKKRKRRRGGVCITYAKNVYFIQLLLLGSFGLLMESPHCLKYDGTNVAN